MNLMTDHELAMLFVDGNADAGYIALANMGEAHKGLQRVQRAVLKRVVEKLRDCWDMSPKGIADEIEAKIKEG